MHAAGCHSSSNSITNVLSESLFSFNDTTPGDSILKMRSDGIASIVAHFESALHADYSSSFCVLKIISIFCYVLFAYFHVQVYTSM